MGGVVHTVTDAIGLTDYGAQKQQAQAAAAQASAVNAASERSYQLTDKQLEFQRQQYEEWKSQYGPIQQNLSNYYSNLSSDNYVSKNVQSIIDEYQKTETNLHKQLAQKGIDSSGIEAAADTALAYQKANAIANVRANSNDYIAKQKMNFLGLGLGQGTQMLGINAQVANAGASNAVGIAGAHANMMGAATSASANLGAANINAMGGMAGAAIGAGAAFAML
jgi:SOS response regulatory protein OraA/RecX